jgi:hypothetical protein
MSDLIERLRRGEAADEIARLREALRQIWDVSADRSAHPDDRAREWVEVRARAALAEDK